MNNWKRTSALLVGIATLFGCVTVTENEQNVQSDPVSMAESRIALGLGYLEQDNMVRAYDNLQQALSHAPRYYRAQLSMAHYYEVVGEKTKAEAMYRRALQQHSNNGNVLNNYGTFLCKQGDYEKADKMFNRAINQPYYYLISASYENAAFCALKAQKEEMAAHYFTRAIDYDPNRPKSILQLASLKIDQHQFTDARRQLLRFHQMYGPQISSLQLLIRLEQSAGNQTLQENYQQQLELLKATREKANNRP
ncbi:type IV pilus biogenesis/stability protein PilW [Vibrio sp. CAU 1672]|uniref:type IV pilus biogenesis/stability protein PilW n=1 Tax=Vibrio sp. CAU 1672 TaxID=3032594 RepID=UPI0023DB7765|nr:type IV pilus biogenesis/stability protein PilW [Vibrio sp. CAU 1672]MDF2152307.1 type IV pilus biogenesis/stability protein PilW [Vibrio sp. CAU 1672]